MPLTQAEITALLTKRAPQGKPKRPPSQQTPILGYPPPQQSGPLRWFEQEMRCAERGCGSSTFAKLQGIPTCSMHNMRKMNQMLLELGVLK